MKVLHVFKSMPPETVGGIETFIETLTRNTVDHGIHHTVFTLSSSAKPTEVITPYYRLVKAKRNLHLASTGFSIGALFKFPKYTREADIIHLHFPWPFMDILLIFSRTKKPIVMTYHSDIIKQKRLLTAYKPLMHWLLRKTDAIVATSPQYAQSSSALRQYNDKVSVIPLGIDDVPRQVSQIPAKKKQRRYFIFVGALRYYKGLHVLIEAARKVDADIFIAGDGLLRSELEKQAENVENVHFLGLIEEEDKHDLLANCVAFVFPSIHRSEAFGISLLEAAAHGKPLITSDIESGIKFVNIHDETGIWVAGGNPDQLGQAMDRLLRDNALRARLSKGARKRFEQFFTSQEMANSYCNLYRGVLSSKSNQNL